MKTLFERMTDWRYYQHRKHFDRGWPDADGYVEDEVNSLSQCDFLKEISAALEEMVNESRNPQNDP